MATVISTGYCGTSRACSHISGSLGKCEQKKRQEKNIRFFNLWKSRFIPRYYPGLPGSIVSVNRNLHFDRARSSHHNVCIMYTSFIWVILQAFQFNCLCYHVLVMGHEIYFRVEFGKFPPRSKCYVRGTIGVPD